ncbi:MAG TPA: hypothetical protein VK400_01890 [Pyrinomonadaceae bacterium]|nr:hypothetical protein [Pyrinomonadaceae bacterium]
MKKFTVTLFLVFVFVFSSTNSFAGDIPIMGKTCPPNTTCVTGDIPVGGLSSGDTQENDPTIFKTVIDYLAQLFG